MTELLTYSLEFRGEGSLDGDVFFVRAYAPSSTHETRLGGEGVAGRFIFEEGAEEAMLEARLVLNGDEGFSAAATIDFGHGHRLHAETMEEGRLGGSADEHLRHGTAVLHAVGGTGQFEGATGRVTCNFVLSDTFDFTDIQLGLLFLADKQRATPIP